MIPPSAVASCATVDNAAKALVGLDRFFLAFCGEAEVEDSCEVIASNAQRATARIADGFIFYPRHLLVGQVFDTWTKLFWHYYDAILVAFASADTVNSYSNGPEIVTGSME